MLNGATVLYGSAMELRATLDYDFSEEKKLSYKNPEFLEVFLRNPQLNENHPLHNRTLHISGTFKEPKKANIGSKKANIGEEKVNVGDTFTVKTASHIQKLQEALDSEAAFGRSEVQRVLGLKPTRSSVLLRERTEHEIIEPVTGHGKGKYRFRQRKTHVNA